MKGMNVNLKFTLQRFASFIYVWRLQKIRAGKNLGFLEKVVRFLGFFKGFF